MLKTRPVDHPSRPRKPNGLIKIKVSKNKFMHDELRAMKSPGPKPINKFRGRI